MIRTERISDAAARAANPKDIEAGRREVDTIAAKLVRRWRILLIIRIAVGSVSVPVAVALAIRHPAWFTNLMIGACIVIALSMFSGRYIQTRKRFFVRQSYDAKLPEGVEHLLTELSAGRMEARLSKEEGLVSASALRTSDGTLLDQIITRTVFTRRYAPMLLSSTATRFDDFWMPWGEKLNGTIHVIVPDVADKAGNQPMSAESRQSETSQPAAAPFTPSAGESGQAASAQLEQPETTRPPADSLAVIVPDAAGTVLGGDSGPEIRDELYKQLAASLDSAKIPKRDVKARHIAERWKRADIPPPDVGTVRSLMKGQQAGAPTKPN